MSFMKDAAIDAANAETKQEWSHVSFLHDLSGKYARNLGAAKAEIILLGMYTKDPATKQRAKEALQRLEQEDAQ